MSYIYNELQAFVTAWLDEQLREERRRMVQGVNYVGHEWSMYRSDTGIGAGMNGLYSVSED